MTAAAQLASRPPVLRTEHVWFRRKAGGWKCCLCGAVTHDARPPSRPEPRDWSPASYELPLTEAERRMVPPALAEGGR